MKAEPYKLEQHRWAASIAGKQCCVQCGLLALNNDFTAWAIRAGCNHKDHPSYEGKRYDFTKLTT